MNIVTKAFLSIMLAVFLAACGASENAESESVLENGLSQMDDAVGGLTEAAGDIAGETVDAVGSAVEAVGDAANNAVEDAGEIMSDVVESAESTVQNAASSLSDKLNTSENEASTKLDEVLSH